MKFIKKRYIDSERKGFAIGRNMPSFHVFRRFIHPSTRKPVKQSHIYQNNKNTSVQNPQIFNKTSAHLLINKLENESVILDNLGCCNLPVLSRSIVRQSEKITTKIRKMKSYWEKKSKYAPHIFKILGFDFLSKKLSYEFVDHSMKGIHLESIEIKEEGVQENFELDESTFEVLSHF